MNIGLVGAPGSGKTDLANALSNELEGSVKIIDDYVDEIGKENDVAVDVDGNYISNLYVLLGRNKLERTANHCGCHNWVISCGTLFDTSVYATYNAMQASESAEEQSQNWTRITNFMNVLGSFYQDTMASIAFYDHVFVMPETDSDNEAYQYIQGNLLLALNSFGYPYTVLDSKDPDEQVAQIVNSINEVEEGINETASVE